MGLTEILKSIEALAGAVSTPAVQAITLDASRVLEKHAEANNIPLEQLRKNSAEIPDPPDPDKETK